MKRYFAEISYDGKNYHGWQVQPNAPSVQETINKALYTLLRTPVNVVGAGRTDSGVHAEHYVLHFDTDAKFELTDLKYKLNCLLPQDIAVQKVYEVASNFHARFDAKARTYEYHVLWEKNPFLYEKAVRLHAKPNFESMNHAAKHLLLFEDFTSFSKLHTDVHTNNCIITEAIWLEKTDGHWYFSITANRFLRNMVRAIVGTLLEVGYGKMSEDEFVEVINAKDRSKAGRSVPAAGLYLTRVEY